MLCCKNSWHDPRQQARVDEVSAHYKHFGGYSPYKSAPKPSAPLEEELSKRGYLIKVEVDTAIGCPGTAMVGKARSKGCERTLLTVLAPHQGKRSWDDYLDEAHAAQQEVEAAPKIIGNAMPCTLILNSSKLLGRIEEALGGSTKNTLCCSLPMPFPSQLNAAPIARRWKKPLPWLPLLLKIVLG